MSSSSIDEHKYKPVEEVTVIAESTPSVPIIQEPVDDVASRGMVRESRQWTIPVTNFTVTSCYEFRWGSMHDGIDLANGTGTPIFAVGSGTITNVGWIYNGYGVSVTIDHGDGWSTFYAHASQALVSKGQSVVSGQKIALIGATGYVTGAHLHFGVFNGSFGNWTNPIPWLSDRGILINGCG